MENINISIIHSNFLLIRLRWNLANSMNSTKKEQVGFFKFIWICKAVNPNLSKIPQGAMLPSLIYSIIGLFLGRISELLNISTHQDYMISFLLIYIIFLLLQILASSLYISAKGVLRTYLAGDMLNVISTCGIYIAFFTYMWIIIFQVINVLYITLLILIYVIMILIFYIQSLRPIKKTKDLLNRMYEQCKEYGSYPDCKTCKMKGR